MATEYKKYIPTHRFSEFQNDGEWAFVLVKNICSISTGKSNTQDQVKDGKYPFFIRSQTPVYSNRYLYDCEAVITIGDGKIGQVFHYINGKFDLHQRCYFMSKFTGVFGKYFYYYFSANFYKRAMRMTAKATVDSVRMEMISDMPFLMPSFNEQKKIADCLSSLDKYIKATKRKLELLKEHKKGLMQRLFPAKGKTTPELRFPEFQNDGEWIPRPLSDILNYEQPTPYIVEDDTYKKEGTPVLTANKGFILGYTDESLGIYSKLPVIIFDDFTTDKKYVDFSFKVKSSAIKLLTLKDEKRDNLRFIFECMNQIAFEEKEHKRYYISTYQHINVYVPSSLQEQNQIADTLLSVDKQISEYDKKIKALELHKKGLMQQLFPKL